MRLTQLHQLRCCCDLVCMAVHYSSTIETNMLRASIKEWVLRKEQLRCYSSVVI